MTTKHHNELLSSFIGYKHKIFPIIDVTTLTINYKSNENISDNLHFKIKNHLPLTEGILVWLFGQKYQ